MLRLLSKSCSRRQSANFVAAAPKGYQARFRAAECKTTITAIRFSLGYLRLSRRCRLRCCCCCEAELAVYQGLLVPCLSANFSLRFTSLFEGWKEQVIVAIEHRCGSNLNLVRHSQRRKGLATSPYLPQLAWQSDLGATSVRSLRSGSSANASAACKRALSQ